MMLNVKMLVMWRSLIRPRSVGVGEIECHRPGFQVSIISQFAVMFHVSMQRGGRRRQPKLGHPPWKAGPEGEESERQGLLQGQQP